MNETNGKRREEQRCWVCLDWGSETHAVSVVNDARQVLGRFKVEASLKGLEQLVKRLGGFGTVAGIAVEATRNPVVNYLASAGFTVYLINPKLSKNWRACNSVAGVKNDERDGLVLAVELAGRHASLRALEREDPAVAELAGLCEKLRTWSMSAPPFCSGSRRRWVNIIRGCWDSLPTGRRPWPGGFCNSSLDRKRWRTPARTR